MVVSNDHRFIVFGSGSENNSQNLVENNVRVWDLIEKKEVAVLTDRINSVIALAISADNKYIVSGSSDRTVVLWNLLEKRVIGILRGHDRPVKAVAITSDNRYIVSASDNETLIIWSFKKKIKKSVLISAAYIRNLLITLDNKNAISYTTQTVQIWDLKKHRERISLQGHNDCIMSLALNVDSKYIITGSLDNTVRVWRLKLFSI